MVWKPTRRQMLAGGGAVVVLGIAGGDGDKSGNNAGGNSSGGGSGGGGGGGSSSDTVTSTSTSTEQTTEQAQTQTQTTEQTQTQTPTATPEPESGGIEILSHEGGSDDLGMYEVTGEVKNATGAKQSYIEIKAFFYDDSGTRIGQGMWNATEVPDGTTLSFTISFLGDGTPADYELKPTASAF